MTMVSWLIATIRPRKGAGETSAMYIGDIIDAIPTPIPATKRNAINKVRLAEKAIAKEEMAKMAAAVSKDGLRPYFSDRLPASKQPAMQPNANTPVVNPSQYSFNPNCSLKNGNAPEITAKSNPNK